MSNIFKVVILIDGGFFLARFQHLNKRSPQISDIEPFTQDVLAKVKALSDVCCSDILFRIFYYACRPYGGTEKDPTGKIIDFSKTSSFRASSKFLDDLKTFPQLALRLGDLSFDGWKLDPLKPTNPPKPDFKQKSVDMKIGLDIAWMSSKKTVDKIVLIAGDSDFVAPMKYARKEGILVYLDVMQQKQIKLKLKEHADFILG